MFWEIFRITVEEANRRAHFSPAVGQVSPRRQIIFNSIFSRIFISIVTLWMLGSGIVILLEAYNYLRAIGLIANTGLVFFSVTTIYVLWKQPWQTHRLLPFLSALLAICSAIVSVSFFCSIWNQKNGSLHPELIWSVMLLLPVAFVYCVFALVGRQHIYLGNYAYLYSDEISEVESTQNNNQRTGDSENMTDPEG